MPASIYHHPSTLPSCGNHSASGSSVYRFLQIGDFGLAGNCEASVALLTQQLVSQFGDFDFAFTTGDNDYWSGSCDSFDLNVGEYYSRFFTKGTSCVNPNDGNLRIVRDSMEESKRQLLSSSQASPPIRFFPTLGNHDFDTFKNYPDKLPYLQYFNYLGSLIPSHDQGYYAQYYTYSPVPDIQLWSLNSNLGDPNNNMNDEFQAQLLWLKESLRTSSAPFKFVFFHHPPFCTAQHDPLAGWMDLPYKDWGVTAVFAGHQHVYERIFYNDMIFIVNGLGGHPWLYDIFNCAIETGSQVRHNSHHGAMIGLISHPQPGISQLDICFYSVENGGTLVDHFEIIAPLHRLQNRRRRWRA